MEEQANEWVECSLKEFERGKCISKVLSIDAEKAAGMVGNYSSDVFRLKMKVVLNCGDVDERYVIHKALPKSAFRREMMLRNGVFEREARMYLDVLPEMEYIRKKQEPFGEPISPECYGVKRRNEGYLIEDLSKSGFELADRRKGLDFDQCVLALKSLAKFHALAAVIKENGTIRLQDFSVHYFGDQFERVDKFYKRNLNDLIYVLEEIWKGEWLVYGAKLRKLSEIIASKVSENFKKDDNKFYTLVHGDFWVNNMMFRSGEDGKANSLRLIDFQRCNYNTPAYDLHYFLQTSPSLENRQRKDELLQLYHGFLSDFLELFEYSGKVPTFEELMQLYNEASYYGLGIGLITMPLLMYTPERGIDVDKLAKCLDDTEVSPLGIYENQQPDSVDALRLVLVEGEKNGLL